MTRPKLIAILTLGIVIGAVLFVFYPRQSTAPTPDLAPRASISNPSHNTTTMLLTSSAFMNNGEIPSRFTCDVKSRTNEGGEDVNPELLIQNVPDGTKSLALIVDDPDAPFDSAQGKPFAFAHWTVWGIDPKTSLIKEESKPPYAIEGETGFGTIGYGGPCPPPGKSHRYFFRLYALDTKLSLPSGATRSELEQAMSGHVLETAELMGTYQR